MAKKNKEEQVNANSLRSAGFSEFESSHEFTAESKLADFTRAAITAGLTNNEIVEIGNDIYGEGKMKLNCINWYRSSDPVLNPGKERYKATGAKALEVRNKVSEYFNGLSEAEQQAFVGDLISAIGIEELIKQTKIETLKSVSPAELFPAPVKKAKKELSDVEKLLKKQKAAEKKAAKLKEELAQLESQPDASAEVVEG